MCDTRVMLIALLLVTPFACSPDRGPTSPPQGRAGSDSGPPTAPATTNEPAVPGVPNARNGPARDTNARAVAALDERSLGQPGTISQPRPGAGGTVGTGGTIGTGGTVGTGGTLGGGGTIGSGGIGTGGSIH
jgi:hypothetical protein